MVQSFASNLEDLYPSSSTKLGKVVLNIVSHLLSFYCKVPLHWAISWYSGFTSPVKAGPNIHIQ